MEQIIKNFKCASEEIKAKSYQLQGCFSKLGKTVPSEHAKFFSKTVDQILEIGKHVEKEAENLSMEVKKNEKVQKDSRKKLVELKRENFQLKRKLEEYETEELDDSLVSSQEVKALEEEPQNKNEKETVEEKNLPKKPRKFKMLHILFYKCCSPFF